jgi:hypothetical protein
MIGRKVDSHATHDLVFGVLHRHLVSHIGGVRKILWLADQERQSLRRCRAANIIAKAIAIASSLFHIDQDEVVQSRYPPCTGFRDVGRAINIHAEPSYDLSTHGALAR